VTHDGEPIAPSRETPRWSTALLTGATHGIGAATARALCPLVEILILHGPEPESQVRLSLDRLRRDNLSAEVVYVQADYARLEDVGAVVSAVRERVDRLDVLINNAGRPGPPHRTLTADGHEVTLQINYLAPLALTTALLADLDDPRVARVINVASATHYSARLRLDDLELEHGYSGVAAYARSKLAIVTYTGWLARRLEGGPAEAASLHPGVIATGLLHAMFGAGGAPVDDGARNIMRLVRRPSPVNGRYFDEDVPARPSPDAVDVANQERLVEASARALTAAGAMAPSPISGPASRAG
jgi:NAD(P)-dependent dehydrogenase (short-subunit alcohol dehydrogenase family)